MSEQDRSQNTLYSCKGTALFGRENKRWEVGGREKKHFFHIEVCWVCTGCVFRKILSFVMKTGSLTLLSDQSDHFFVMQILNTQTINPVHFITALCF